MCSLASPELQKFTRLRWLIGIRHICKLVDGFLRVRNIRSPSLLRLQGPGDQPQPRARVALGRGR